MHALVKPAGPRCNLNCTYCYHLYKQDLLSTGSHWRISDENLEACIRQSTGEHDIHARLN